MKILNYIVNINYPLLHKNALHHQYVSMENDIYELPDVDEIITYSHITFITIPGIYPSIEAWAEERARAVKEIQEKYTRR